MFFDAALVVGDLRVNSVVDSIIFPSFTCFVSNVCSVDDPVCIDTWFATSSAEDVHGVPVF